MIVPFVTQLHLENPQVRKQVCALLEEEGIRLDSHIDYTCGLYDGTDLVATGSCFQNTLRCLAVNHSHQGEGLLNQIVSHLLEIQVERGHVHLFLYTKPDAAPFFSTLGFYEVARLENQLVFMENRRAGFSSYLEKLQDETRTFCASHGIRPKKVAAIIMNANPFTLGHQYLVEKASAENDLVQLFVVSEDSSSFPFSIRKQLVLQGTAQYPNVCCHDTGCYLISTATFPSYFLRDSLSAIRTHALLDITLFTRIAHTLDIRSRYLGEEPASVVTGIYNQLMAENLPRQGIVCRILPRREITDLPKDSLCQLPGIGSAGIPISASTVRLALKEDCPELWEKLVPACTRAYLSSSEAQPVIEHLTQT